jgi:Tfp pilus assembly PilM family ATPase
LHLEARVAFGLDKLGSLNPFAGGGLLSVDLGAQSLKVLQATPGEPGQLVGAACGQVPVELAGDANKRFEAQCDELAGLVKSAGLKARRAMVAIPASHMFSKHVQVGAGDRREIDAQVAAAVAGQLGCDASMLSCRGVVIEGAACPPGKVEVLAMATASSLIGRLMEALKGAKLEPVGMASEFQAVLSSFRPVNRRVADADIASMYLDIGAGTTKIVIGHGSKLAFAKAIPMGGRFLDQCVAEQSRCSIGEARALRLGLTTLTRAPGGVAAGGAGASAAAAGAMSGQMAALGAAMRKEMAGGGTATAVAAGAGAEGAAGAARQLAGAGTPAIDMAESLRAMTDEIALSLRYHEQLFPGKKVSRLIFVGGESRHVPLCQHIARTLRVPAHAADPLARVARTGKEHCAGVDFSGPQPGWAVPMGLLLNPSDV